MSTFNDVMKLAFNSDLIDKNVAGDPSLFVEGFENGEFTIPEFSRRIKLGHGYCAQLSGRRQAANFLACNAVSVDVDGGMRIEEALANPVIQKHAALIYTTCRHSAEKHRYRVLLPLPETITDAQEFRTITSVLTRILAGDRSAVDAARVSFGNRDTEIHLIGQAISPEFLEELRRTGFGSSSGAPSIEKGLVEAQRRFSTPIQRDQKVRIAGGGTATLSELEQRTRIHCPVHADRSPSARVVENRYGLKGVYCSACKTTFWSAQSLPEDSALEDFEAVIRETDKPTGYQPRGPVGRFVNEWLAKEGITGRHIHIVSGRPTPPVLLPGIIFAKSPKGSGKTHGVARLIAMSTRVLMISHRRSLVRNSCLRLNLTSYLDAAGRVRGPSELDEADDQLTGFTHFPTDDEVSEPGLRKAAPGKHRFGICVDSLLQVSPSTVYDVVILDEIDQLLAHFLGGTIERRQGGGRDRIFQLFRHFIRNAKYVIALDADLGWTAFVTLCRMVSDKGADGRHILSKPVHVWINEAESTHKKLIQVFASQNHLVGDLMQVISEGKRCYVTSNSKRLLNNLREAIAERFGADRRVITITSETTSRAEVLEFLENPVRHVEQYDAVLASPSISTGVDITFEGGAEKVDVVYGFLLPKLISHLDFDQQLARVRHPGAVKVWIDPRRFAFETHPDVVHSSLLRESVYKNLLSHYEPDRTARYIEDDPFIEMAALITAQKQASLNDLLGNYIRYKEAQGFRIERVGSEAEVGKVGREALRDGKARHARKVAEQILAARPLPRPDYERVRQALEAGVAVSEADDASCARTSLELFYRQEISSELIHQDDDGRHRNRIGLFEDVTRMPPERVWLGDPKAPLPHRMRFVRSRDDKAGVVRRLLRLTPFWREVPTRDEGPSGSLDPQVVFDQSHLGELAEFISANKGQVENVLEIEVRRDLRDKTLQQLNVILKLIGLKAVNVSTKKVRGAKTYRYRLDGSLLEGIQATVERRSKRQAWPTLIRLHGPQMDPVTEDEEDWRDE